MNVNFQIMKRILCCLLAVLVLFCAYARPIEASAVAAAAGALVCAITPEIAVSAAITALGITYLVQTDYEELVAAISATVPGKYLIDTLADGKQVRGVVYDHKCYLSKDFVSWVSDKLWTGTSATTTPAVSHTYGFTGIVDGVYKNCVSWLNSAYPGELNKCEAYSNCYVTRVLDDDRNRYDVCAFSDGAVEFKIDSNGYFCWGTTTDAKLIYTSGVKSFMGFIRDDATKSWLAIPLCASPLPAYTARSPGTAARPFRGFPIYFPEIRPWLRCCACWQRSFSWN